jgi:hypothetical protein
MGSSSAAAQLAVSQVWLSSMKLVKATLTGLGRVQYHSFLNVGYESPSLMIKRQLFIDLTL